jgi:tRNA splicing endonuclease
MPSNCSRFIGKKILFLRIRGRYTTTLGDKFGGDFLVYPEAGEEISELVIPTADDYKGEREESTHSFYIVKKTSKLKMNDLIIHCRLAKQTNKYFVFYDQKPGEEEKSVLVCWSGWTGI